MPSPYRSTRPAASQHGGPGGLRWEPRWERCARKTASGGLNWNQAGRIGADPRDYWDFSAFRGGMAEGCIEAPNNGATADTAAPVTALPTGGEVASPEDMETLQAMLNLLSTPGENSDSGGFATAPAEVTRLADAAVEATGGENTTGPSVAQDPELAQALAALPSAVNGWGIGATLPDFSDLALASGAGPLTESGAQQLLMQPMPPTSSASLLSGQPLYQNPYTAITDALDIGNNNFDASSNGHQLGALSEKYESNGNPGAIGYDNRGGTSYGMYQIASRTGTMDAFLNYLGGVNTDWQTNLLNAGPSNTGSRNGDFPDAWRQVAQEDPEGFAQAQHGFIMTSHYDPVVQQVINNTGVDINERSDALQDVVWSTAVQHHTAANLITSAINAAGGSDATDEDIINGIYRNRSNLVSNLTGLPQNQINGIQNRYFHERIDALNELNQGN